MENYVDEEKSSLDQQHLLSTIELQHAESQRKKSSIRISWLVHALYITAILSLAICLHLTYRSPSAMQCTKQENTWSPAQSAILPYKEVEFNGTLEAPSPWRGDPSPEVDAAWETLVRMNADEGFGISDEEYLKLGHPLDENVVRLNATQGGGIFAGLEVFHQMHCLNLIRQYTYFDYYKTRAITFTDPADILRTHVDHCIEMLRQKLTCDADVGVITHKWVARRETPWPDFNVRHKCRNFDGVVEWSKKNQAPGLDTLMWRPSHIAGLDPPP